MFGSPAPDARGRSPSDFNGPLLWAVFLDGSSPPMPTPENPLAPFDLVVVLRVHTHDPSAASCSADVRVQCDVAVVVDAVVWKATVGPSAVPYPSGALFADGIPSTLDGQPVLRPTQAAAQAAASTDARRSWSAAG